MLTLLSLHQFNDKDKSKLVEGLQDFYTIIFPDDFTEDNLTALASSAQVLLGMKVTEKILNNCPYLRLVQTPSAGVDKLHLSLLKKRGVLLCNSHSNSYYVAEYTVALLFALSKRIALQNQSALLAGTLRGRVVGILGYGNIGKQVCEFLNPFGCKLMVFRHQKIENNDSGIYFTNNLKEVLSQADYIVITLPLTTSTNGLIGAGEFAVMKKSAGLINVGRGPVINQEALYLALKDKKIQAVAIDVWYDDFVKSDNSVQFSTKFPFEKLDNVILSPYRAAAVEGAPHLDDVIKNLRLFATSGKVINVVDLEQGY